MIGTVGDLVEDILVRLHGTVNVADDTDATVLRQRGGSAANMAVSVARAGHPVRFIGQVGADAAGAQLIETLIAEGVEAAVRRAGRTGTIIVLLDERGERTMLTDRGAAAQLDHPDPAWLDDLSTLHIPLYALLSEPLATTVRTLARWANERGVVVSVDASSAAALATLGVDNAVAALVEMRPSILVCNELEAAALGDSLLPERLGTALSIVKHGPDPAVVHRLGEAPLEVPAIAVEGVTDTTGAGDAFAAGLLIALANGASPAAATALGHQTAARHIRAAAGRV